MRLWSLHPEYLDQKGLVALWREALLAKAVLKGLTKGYKNHPQLQRFKNCKSPIAAINNYLYTIYSEAEKRGYKFVRKKIGALNKITPIRVTNGQLHYEMEHLNKKLKLRAPSCTIKDNKKIKANPMFTIKTGNIEEWEKSSNRSKRITSEH